MTNSNSNTTIVTTNSGATIALDPFVLRQTAESKYSHFAGTWDELLERARIGFSEASPGYRDGVILVPSMTDDFFSGVVEVTPETVLRAEFSARRRGEEPYISVVAVGGRKLPAATVELVLYRRDVLLEDDPETPVEADWHLVSINARPTEGPEPLTPQAMARNFLALAGGSKAEYSAEEFARSIIYWSTRAMCG
jgi:hypothetical protein